MSHAMKRRDILKGSIAMTAGLAGAGEVSGSPDENPFPPMKIEFKNPERYSPLAYLERVDTEADPQLAFRAGTSAEASAWRDALRPALWDLLGEHHDPDASTPASKRIETVQRDGFRQEKIEIEAASGRWMPVYVLIPDDARPPYRTVVCLHGHGNGARDIINQPVDEETRELIGILNTDYALQCVRRGWCAVAPELFSFGERLDLVEGARDGFDGGCEKPFLNAVQLGKTLIGIRTKDICKLIAYLGASAEFDLDDLACVGLSGGGMMTMYAAALDERIKRACISGYITEMKGSILGIRHCSCNYVPGLAPVADFPDIAGCIAPRQLIVQSGKRDAIFPIESARRAYAGIRRAYEVFGAADAVRMDEHNGFHEFSSASLDTLLA